MVSKINIVFNFKNSYFHNRLLHGKEGHLGHHAALPEVPKRLSSPFWPRSTPTPSFWASPSSLLLPHLAREKPVQVRLLCPLENGRAIYTQVMLTPLSFVYWLLLFCVTLPSTLFLLQLLMMSSKNVWVTVPPLFLWGLNVWLIFWFIPSKWHICTHTHTFMLSCFHHVWLCVILWAVACQVPLSMRFSRQEYIIGLPCLPPRDLPDPGIEPTLAGVFFTTSATWEAYSQTWFRD